ncbi:polynucleotide kinase-phosphatase [Peribacillus muralis]|uniref:polynucleotide kinase-phosphatase n=1 Tax=Peribacillus muralis TaxID=264697 RepID=UPI001F4DA7F3|nr:polynucleotide kinase-phosphatase [Peribacillus muralis]MCK1992094.1 polynucleotide kinase-phosphatase [Peribacillus muralis]MCK2012650.1 polynucleotide kinase-phosphatase [Peribacillus muralis]
MPILLPYAGIVLLVGPSNSGKTTLLKRMIEKEEILPSEVISSDDFRIMVSDIDFIDWRDRAKDEADTLMDEYQTISGEAFSMMDAVIEARCRLNKLTIIDATNLHPDDRKRYIMIADKHHVPVQAIVLDTPEEVLLARDEGREHPRGKRRIKQQCQTFKREMRYLKKEGYASVYTIKETENLEISRGTNPLEKDIGHGIDIIGDIHGCYQELILLLEKLGYHKNQGGLYLHPQGRKFVSVGDVMSRGPESLKTMLFFLEHVQQDAAYMIDSNHGWKIARWLDGRSVTLKHGDEKVEEEFNKYEEEYGSEKAAETKQVLKEFLLHASSHYVFTKNGVQTVICVHAGIRDAFIGKQSEVISDFCRYGDNDGFDESGKPVRKDWYIAHKKSTLIVWGHDPKPQPLLINNTINIDQGAVFGGALTAFRYPEREVISVQASEDHSGDDDSPLKEWERNRLNPPNIRKFIEGYSVLTERMGEIKVQSDMVKPAIDKISHFTIPLEQLIYIPPTMSPTPSPSSADNYLEHPREAIDYYRSNGIQTMIAEKKHMGSRAILFLFRDKEASKKYTGIESLGVIHTRTGRRFFDVKTEEQLVLRINQDLRESGYFEKYETDYVLLDAEIMPWNLKAKELISSQYAHVAENAILDRTMLKEKIEKAVPEHADLKGWLEEYELKLENARTFQQVFQKYCWDIEDMDSIQIAPFHVLAHSGQAFFDKPHTWHMEKNQEFAKCSSLFVETEYKVITDEASEEEVIKWWEDITSEGHEGIVIKPEFFIARNKGKLLQPAIKVRGRKYLNIIYGMDYLLPKNLERLKNRNTGKKQKLALREFSLGIEGIQRYVKGESIERVHECVLGTLAMESDPVDPRL